MIHIKLLIGMIIYNNWLSKKTCCLMIVGYAAYAVCNYVVRNCAACAAMQCATV